VDYTPYLIFLSDYEYRSETVSRIPLGGGFHEKEIKAAQNDPSEDKARSSRPGAREIRSTRESSVT
jgi:hypothetical protein